MKIKNSGMVFLSILLITVGCQGKSKTQVSEEKNDKLETQEENVKEGEMPFKDLNKDDIEEVKMSTSTEEVKLTEEEIAEFVELLRQVVIYEAIEPEPLSGGGERFKILYTDGSLLDIFNDGNVYLHIEDVSYEIEKEPMYELSEFSYRILGITYSEIYGHE